MPQAFLITHHLLLYIHCLSFSEISNSFSTSTDCQEEGLFRKTGSVIRQAELRAMLCAGEVVDLHQGDFSVHDCASVLKSFLHEMEEPLLTHALFQPFMKVVGKSLNCSLIFPLMKTSNILSFETVNKLCHTQLNRIQ